MAGYKIKVLQKLFAILDLFFDENVEMTAGEIAKTLEMNRTSTFRILSNLEEEGYLEFDPATARYRLGPKLLILGSYANPFLHLKRAARPFLEKLNRQSGETVHLAVLRGGETFYLDKIEGRKTIRVTLSQVGHQLPAHCSSVGKLLLAFIPEEEAENHVSARGLEVFTENTIRTWTQLKDELRKIRREGLSRDLEEVEYGLACLAAPVHCGETVVAAVSVSMPITRLQSESATMQALVTEAAEAVSGQLGEAFPDGTWTAWRHNG